MRHRSKLRRVTSTRAPRHRGLVAGTRAVLRRGLVVGARAALHRGLVVGARAALHRGLVVGARAALHRALVVGAACALLTPTVRADLAEARCTLVASRLPAALAMCSELVVAEDPNRPDGPQLRLFVARIPALTAAPRADPLVLIAGGPGQAAVDFYLQMRRAFEPARRERDIVLLDQRGTGRSAGGYECELNEAAALSGGASEQLGAALEDCLASIERDPRFYSTSPAVGDLDALRAALGVEQWNLYGISYGTRVAQHYAKRFPQRLRTLILDGVVPADLVLGPDIATDAEKALEGIFARCAADAACGSRYGDLDRQFADLRVRLASGPVSIEIANPATGDVEERLFTEADLQGVVRLMSYSAATASLLPLAIDDAHGGDYALLAAQVDILTGELTKTLSMPMHNSVVCTEDVPFFDAARTAVTSDAYLGSTIVDSLRGICAVWPAGVIDPGFKRSAEFTGPVLLLSGENDPVTPPAYAIHAIAHGLRNSVHLIGRGQGHGMAGIGCVPRLMAAFLESASPGAVNGACLDAEPPAPFFLSTLGPAP